MSPRSYALLVAGAQPIFSTYAIMLSKINPTSIVTLCSLCFHLVSSLTCNGEVYGNPKVEDCEEALLEIPCARGPVGSDQSQYNQFFAEPQFLEPPFRGISNRFRPRAIIQLPKFWKHSKCHSQNHNALPSIHLCMTVTPLTRKCPSQTPAA